MRTLSIQKKYAIIRLFLEGLPYDDIVRQTGAAKGSIVNVVEAFRNGDLQIPEGLRETLDSIRKLAVDLKKHDTSVIEVIQNLKIHNKVIEMGVCPDDVMAWLEVTNQIASESDDKDGFARAALDLTSLTSETGISYKQLLARYETLLQEFNQLAKKTQSLTGQKVELDKDQDRLRSEIQSVKNELVKIQKRYSNEHHRLTEQRNQFLRDSRLSWQKINMVISLLETGLNKVGLPKRTRTTLLRRIVKAGSLTKTIVGFEKQVKLFEMRIEELINSRKQCESQAIQAQNIESSFRKQMVEQFDRWANVKDKVQAGKTELEELERTIQEKKLFVFMTDAIFRFLITAEADDNQIDKLVSVLVVLRQQRLGYGPKRVIDQAGNVVCQCQIPNIQIELNEAEANQARDLLAQVVFPCIADRMVTREYMEQEKREARLLGQNDALQQLLNESSEKHSGI